MIGHWLTRTCKHRPCGGERREAQQERPGLCEAGRGRGAGCPTTRGSLSARRRGDSARVHVCTCACVCVSSVCTDLGDSAPGPAEGLSWAACQSPGSGLGCRVGGRLVARALEGPAGPALRVVGHAAGRGGVRPSIPRAFVQLLPAVHVQGLRRTGPPSLLPSAPSCGAEVGRASRGLWCA